MERFTQITQNIQRDTQTQKYLLLVDETVYILVYILGLLIASLHHTFIGSSADI